MTYQFGVLTFFIVFLVLIIFLGLFLLIKGYRGKTISVPLYICLALLLFSGFFEARYIYIQNQATQAVRTMTKDDDLIVRCERFTKALIDTQPRMMGWVDYEHPHIINLKRKTCLDLNAYSWSDKASPDRHQITAVHILSHEAMHTQDIQNEAEAECYAVQYNRHIAKIYGATTQQAERLSHDYYVNMYPHLPHNYLSKQCFAGGELDLNIDASQDPNTFP